MNVHIISFTQAGFSLSKRLQNLLQADFSENPRQLTVSFGGKAWNEESSSVYQHVSLWVQSFFQKGNALIFIGAAGIAVRSIASFIKNKATDPAVIVLDEKGSFVIPVLSGHIGGANELSRKIASLIGATPVITTASDCNNLPAIDEFASKNNLLINDMKFAKDFTSLMLKFENPLSQTKKTVKKIKSPEFTLSVYIKNDILSLIPKCVVLGVGCRKGKSPQELQDFVLETLKSHKIDNRSLVQLCSVDQKKEETALISLSESLKLPFVTFSAEKLNEIPQKVSHSDFVEKTLGTDNVCERAVFAAGAIKLIVPKTAKDGMTIAAGIKKLDFEIPEELKRFEICTEN